MKILTCKIGNKYSANDVNKLFVELRKLYPRSLEFYCYTEDPFSLAPDIKVIKPDVFYDGVWNKLSLFKYDLGKILYLDLDVIVHNKLDELLNKESFTLVQCYWKPKKELKWPDHNINSSVMYWNGLENKKIYDKFASDPEFYMFKYFGIDHFIFHEKFSYDTWDQGLIYSHRYGINEDSWYNPKPNPYYKEDALVCLLNGATKEFQYPQSSSPTYSYQE